MSNSAQGYRPDPRNEQVLVCVNGVFVPKAQATVSVFDSGFVCGDGVWEGLRLVNGNIISLDDHLQRLFAGAASVEIDIGIPKSELTELIHATLRHNDMHDGVHIRVMVTRGTKSTPNQDPRCVLGKATIVIVAEYKVVSPESKAKGLSLFTSTFRCSPPDIFDLRLNSHSRLNLIQALIQAINAGADEALMLDPHGFVASCNSTNFFIVKNGQLCTSSGCYCFTGITRKTVMRLATDNHIALFSGDFTLAEVYTSQEAFVTGTLAGITPVTRVDGKTIGNGQPGPITGTLSDLYQAYITGQ